MMTDQSLDYHGWSLTVGDDLVVFENSEGLHFYSDLMRCRHGEFTYCQERDALQFTTLFPSSLDIVWRDKELIIQQRPPYPLLDLFEKLE